MGSRALQNHGPYTPPPVACPQVLFELLAWRLPWTFADMSPFKVTRAGDVSTTVAMGVCATGVRNRCVQPFALRRWAPSSGGAAAQICRLARSCRGPMVPAGPAWTDMCNSCGEAAAHACATRLGCCMRLPQSAVVVVIAQTHGMLPWAPTVRSECWAQLPAERPTFDSVVGRLQHLLESTE